MPTDLEVWEIFLDHEIQMAQNVGWKDRNAQNSLLAVTRKCFFAEFLPRCKTAAVKMQNPLNAYSSSSVLFSFCIFSFHTRAQFTVYFCSRKYLGDQMLAFEPS
jgi:hypothetical protein